MSREPLTGEHLADFRTALTPLCQAMLVEAVRSHGQPTQAVLAVAERLARELARWQVYGGATLDMLVSRETQPAALAVVEAAFELAVTLDRPGWVRSISQADLMRATDKYIAGGSP